MLTLKKLYMPEAPNANWGSLSEQKQEQAEAQNEKPKKKNFFQRLRQMLQDWSNDDARDLEFDDSRP